MATRKPIVSNFLLNALPVGQKNRILKLCASIDLEFGTVICEPHQAYKYVYFPLTSFISSIVIVADLPPLEVGLIGNEGMLGVGAVLGINKAPLQSVVQGSGTALRLPIEQFQRELKTATDLTGMLNRYIYVSMQQLARAMVCIHVHEVQERLARWLLMTNDRAHQDVFLLTHAFLAQMLGVRRSGVSIAANELRKKNLISYSRGKIRIIDRKGLEAASCSCYAAMKGYYNELLGT